MRKRILTLAGGLALFFASAVFVAAQDVQDPATPQAPADAVADEATPMSESPEYDVPLIGVSSLRRGAETQLTTTLFDRLAGTRAGVYIKPLKSGYTRIRINLPDLKEPESSARYVLWAVAPDQTYTRLGEADKFDKKKGVRIETHTRLSDFGLFITAEDEDAAASPKGPAVAIAVR